MENSIKNNAGTTVGTWDGQRIQDLIDELAKLGTKDLDMAGLPHADQIPEDINTMYPVWACDSQGRCLVGDAADEIETVDEVRESQQ